MWRFLCWVYPIPGWSLCPMLGCLICPLTGWWLFQYRYYDTLDARIVCSLFGQWCIKYSGDVLVHLIIHTMPLRKIGANGSRIWIHTKPVNHKAQDKGWNVVRNRFVHHKKNQKPTVLSKCFHYAQDACQHYKVCLHCAYLSGCR